MHMHMCMHMCMSMCLQISMCLCISEMAKHVHVHVHVHVSPQVAYKYLVAEKLPNLGYATFIDSYVLLCFVTTFAVLVAQCPAAVGLYIEPTFAVNITEGSETRVVLVPTLGFALFGSWVVLHVMLWLVVVVLSLRVYRADPFWFGHHRANTAAWIGSVTDDVTEEQVESFLEELVSWRRTNVEGSSASSRRGSMFAFGRKTH